jgi:phosphoglycerol transferase MdoB-like AlkP superfamily enzyme
MKIKFLLSSGKGIWKNNKPFIVFVFILFVIYSLIKIIFYSNNQHFIFNDIQGGVGEGVNLTVLKWSLVTDLMIILLINVPLLFLLQLSRWKFNVIFTYIILPIFVVGNSFVIFLNVVDVFYFKFHFQRADADLFHVIDYPLKKLFGLNFFIIAAFLIIIASIILLLTKLCKSLYHSFKLGFRCNAITLLFAGTLLLIPFYMNYAKKTLLPTYPLVNLSSKQLIIVQNSFHTFIYSLLRNNHDATIKNYMSIKQAEQELPIKKILPLLKENQAQKNIVLFIMESVPYDFFDSTSEYKVQMPFFDSIIQKSTFFNNAFSYSLESNKGITAVLAGTPTLTDVPLYHSAFTNMPITAIGAALQKNNYQSFFCIGDDFNNFGFAECVNWLGIKKYYCRNDMGKFVTLPPHYMGLQDEDVLNFMTNKIDEIKQPFLAINYNISTHYPYDIPAGYANKIDNRYTDAMKSMSYYDYSLHQFFNGAKNKLWFNNTIFIFCPDHWMFPNDKKINFNAVNSHKIPIIIYDPSLNKKTTNSSLVSQFDVLGTILNIGQYNDSIISYGGSLLDINSLNKVAFCKMNDGLYQVIDTSYVLGFSAKSNKVEYLFDYKTDKNLKINLLKTSSAKPIIDRLTTKIKAFLQNSTRQYHSYIH